MSATNRGSERIDGDKYYTPTRSISSLIPLINWNGIQTVLEPCRGRGNIVYTVTDYLAYKQYVVPEFTTYEIEEGTDYLQQPFNTTYDLCITNPPFSLAQQFIEKALSECNAVVMLLRLNYLGSQSRREWWNDNLPTSVLVLSERPSFVSQCPHCKTFYVTGDFTHCHKCLYGPRGITIKLRKTTDATEYAWFAWDYHDILGLPTIGVL